MGLVVDFGACCGEDDEEELMRAKGFGKLELRANVFETSKSDSVRRAFSEVGGKAVQLGFGFWVFFLGLNYSVVGGAIWLIGGGCGWWQ